ncbi:MAG: transglutaminase-like cysteine peptidase [Porticoccus sp.]|nr:transglutaminase-like cysteine peptidase [Porticoccus sp.]
MNSTGSSALKASFAWLPITIISLFTVAIAQHQGVSEKVISKIRHKYGPTAETRVRHWDRLIDQYYSSDDKQKLTIVNDFFNGARFVSDIKQWNKTDYWATPLEFLANDAGDCEDFSIAKYFTLKKMGLDTAKLRIHYVKATTLNQAHMVLAYYSTPNAEPLILDNLNKLIKPASQRPDLRPVYSFNADNLWLAKTRTKHVKAGKPGQLNLWRDLNNRMRRELL